MKGDTDMAYLGTLVKGAKVIDVAEAPAKVPDALPVKVTVCQSITAAKNAIATPERWTKNREHDFGLDPRTGKMLDQYCMLGALRTYAGTNWLASRRYIAEAISQMGGAVLESDENTITAWNDIPARKHADVLKAMERAILLATEQGECDI